MKISKKAVKLGSFLHCSVHIILGHDGCFRKITLNFCETTLWRTFKQSMVNVTASYSLKRFLLKILYNYWTYCLVDSRILYFWKILEFIDQFIIVLLVLQPLFVRDLTKNKGGVGLFQTSQKERLLLWQPSALGGNLTMFPG